MAAWHRHICDWLVLHHWRICVRTHAPTVPGQSVTNVSVKHAATHISVADTVVSVPCRHRTHSQREELTSIYAVLHNAHHTKHAIQYIYLYTCICVL